MPTASTITPTHLIVLAECECAGDDNAELRHIADAARGRHVRVVAPAGPIPGEDWLVDVTAREQEARRRIESWTRALAPFAATVAGEVGDENPRLALADARRDVGRDAPVLSARGATASTLAARRATRPLPVHSRRFVAGALAGR
jgi:hypothetical protein